MANKSEDGLKMINIEEFKKLSLAEQMEYLIHKREEIKKSIAQSKI